MRFLVIVFLSVRFAGNSIYSAELPSNISHLLDAKCLECHDTETKKGGLDLEKLIDGFDPNQDVEKWEKVDLAISRGEMPPKKKGTLSNDQIQSFAKWFASEFVLPGGEQQPGRTIPRKLTREELQNTLEDVLGIPLRVSVTNSRLHVIPDTVIEKFFPAGVYGKSGFSNDSEALRSGAVDLQTLARCFSLVLAKVDPGDVNPAIWIPSFAEKAFRRPLKSGEAENFIQVFEKMSATQTRLEALRSAMLSVLLSPEFWIRFEDSTSDGQLTNREMAIRISYFLWSSPPDEELLEADLQDDAVIRAQVRRMLADPKRIALAENLGGEWFDYKKLRQQSAVNKRSDRMAGFYRSQYEEALLFFDSLLCYDQPLFKIVDADWAYTNGHQTNLYRLQRTQRRELSKNPLPPINIHYRDNSSTIVTKGYEYKHSPMDIVFLDDPFRGGFITLGPTLSATSTQNRTSPIRRGVWVMERILGRHFEVPENIPDLAESQKKAKSQNLKLDPNEILKLHSSQPGCASCHSYIDPIGFGLEVYDQLGILRPPKPNPNGMKLTWSPKETPKAFEERSWTLPKELQPGEKFHVHFQWTKGSHRLDAKNVRLTSGDVKLEDAHHGYTGTRNSKNTWHFTIPRDAPKKDWTLTAIIKGDGGNNSHGTITISPPYEGPTYKLPNGNSFSSPTDLKERLLKDYREDIIDNAIKRVLAYALGRKTLPLDRPAIEQIRSEIAKQDYRMNALLESVALSFPFRHKSTPEQISKIQD